MRGESKKQKWERSLAWDFFLKGGGGDKQFYFNLPRQ